MMRLMHLDGCISLGAATQEVSALHFPPRGLLLQVSSCGNLSRLRYGFRGNEAGSMDHVKFPGPWSIVLSVMVELPGTLDGAVPGMGLL